MKELWEHLIRMDYDEVFNILSLGHILTCTLFVIGFILIFLKAGDIRKIPIFKKLEKLLVFVVIGAQGIYYFWYFILGAGGDAYPLYLCRIAGLLICITYFIPIKPLEDFAIMSCIYGGISSTFFSSPKPFAFPHITRWAYFTMHIGMVYLALLRVVFHHKIFTKKELLNAEILTVITCIIVLSLDIKFGWNYMFFMNIKPPEMPIIEDITWFEPLNVKPWMTSCFMFFAYMFGAFCAWAFTSWMSRKALRMEFVEAFEDAKKL